MTPVRCPRCHRVAAAPRAYCAGCGAPLLLGDDATTRPLDAALEDGWLARPLDAALDLDRRVRDEANAGGRLVASPPLGLAETPVPGSLAVAAGPDGGELDRLDRSHWDLGGLLAAISAEPEPGPDPVAPPPDRAAPLRSAHPARDPEPAHPVRDPDPADDLLPDLEVDALEIHVARAEPWRRAGAWAIDCVPFAVAGGALARSLLLEAGAGKARAPEGLEALLDLLARERVITLSVGAAVVLGLAVYTTLAHALAGATLGKRLLGMRVVGPDGAPPSPARSAFRSTVALASAALLGLGFVLALFTRTGRSFHDLLARTWVVKAP